METGTTGEELRRKAYSKNTMALQLIREQKSIAADRLLLGLALLALVAVPISVSRAFYVGWNSTFTLHITGIIVLLGFSLYRKRFTTEQKAWFVLSIGTLISVFGLFTYGLVGNGLLWGMFAVLVSLFFLNIRIAYSITSIILFAFLVTGFQFVYGGKTFPVDADFYLSQLSSWGTALVGSAMFIILIASLNAGLRRQQDDLLLELENKNRELDSMNVEISRLANYDDLTGLPVLRQFKENTDYALIQRSRGSRFIALCFLDLDGFKDVNDTYGHDAGDLILRSVARRLSSNIRHQDIASRIGGDEFAILLNSDEEIDLDGFCVRLLTTINEPYLYGETELRVSASVGVACATQDNMTTDDLLKKADEAMYRVKRQGKNHYLVT